KTGKKVTLVEDGFLASGESGRTTAHLTAALDDRYYFIENVFGQSAAALAAESHTSAIAEIGRIVQSEQIDCHFKKVSGYLFLDPTDKPSHLEKEFDATQRAGLNTQFLESVPAMAGGEQMKSVEFVGQAQFHITKYLNGLADAILSLGGNIFTQT